MKLILDFGGEAESFLNLKRMYMYIQVSMDIVKDFAYLLIVFFNFGLF